VIGLRVFSRIFLGAALVFAGIGHLSFSRVAFQAQVPTWLPMDPDLVVILSGLVEIALGLALIFLGRYKKYVGLATALFFVAIFPGNISQFLTETDAFGLNSNEARLTRLFFQPLLVLWALYAGDVFRGFSRTK
jgi:uncharacterized membrane protein